MQILGLVWRERSSDSQFVESVWKCNTPVATSRVAIADPCISISLEENKGKSQVIIIGPTTKPYRVSLAAGYTCTTIRLRLGCFLKDSLARELMKHPIVLPADSEGRFWLKGVCFRFPGFNQAELLVDDLYKWGCLDQSDPRKGRRASSDRTYSRYVRRITGLSPYQLYQLQRIHDALRLIKHGVPPVEVAAQLGFADQSHMVHASKQFLDHTPKQLTDLPQIP